MNAKATALDVARLAQVSRAAVSLVLSGQAAKARLSAATQERVLKAADELNYRPNATGRSLKSGRSETIGLVIRDLALLDLDPFLLPLMNGIISRSRREGYRVLVESARSGSNTDSFAELMDSGRIDGMIVENPDYEDSALYRLVEAGRPIIVLGTKGQKGEFSVSADDREVAGLAIRHLVELGRRRIAHIPYAESGIYGVDERLAGYRLTMKEAGLAVPPGFVRHASFAMESGYAAMQELLALETRPDALFAGSDAIAIGAMAAIKDASLRIPQDIAVVGVDDIAGARFCRPSLTTIVNDPFQGGRLAADMLIELLSGRKPAVTNPVLPSTLVVRGSTDEGFVEGTTSTR